MLDTTTTTLALLLPIRTLAGRDHFSAGDAVSYCFPVAEEGAAGPRPGLASCSMSRPSAVRYALLAYGTSSPKGANRGYEVRVRGPEALHSAGLSVRRSIQRSGGSFPDERPSHRRG